MNSLKALFAILALAMGALAATPGGSAAVPERTDDPTPVPDLPFLAEGRTPLQAAIARTLAERRAQGLPVPTVTFEFTRESGPGPTTLTPQGVKPGQVVTLVGRTTVAYDDPEQAGRTRWPDLVLSGSLPPGAHGTFIPGDYSPLVKAKLAERIPGIWDRYTFGQEPRTCTYTERLTITWPAEGAAGALPTPEAPQSNDVLMGFTLIGPNIDYTIGDCLEVLDVDVACFEVGFAFDYGLGLRLPMQIGTDLAESMLEGSDYSGSTSALGVDWAHERFDLAGVPSEGGKEFVMRLLVFAGARLEVFGSGVANFGIDIDQNESKSFAAPFGPGATFDIPSLNIPVWSKDLVIAGAEVGVRLTPQLGSDRFDANWATTGEATGSGSLSYTNPAIPLALGAVSALDGPGYANVTLDDFKYYFTNFLLKLELYLYIDVFVTDKTWTFGLPGIDLSAITSNLYVGPHAGTPSSMTRSIPIENVAPTAVIDRTGATLIHGVPTFVAEHLAPISFTGTATDPGRDDLTLTWDWDDGAPSPDVSTTYAVPHEVTETRAHAFDSSCLFEAAFKAVDDDGAAGVDKVKVMIVPDERQLARMEGYWQHQLAQTGATDFDAATLECLLAVVGHCSGVFSEVRDVSTAQLAYEQLFAEEEVQDGAPAEGAHDVLFLQRNHGSALEQLDRELLVTWLNFTQGTFRYSELLDTDGDGAGDVPFASFMDGVEAIRLDPDASEGALRRQAAALHALNAARTDHLVAAVYAAGAPQGDARGAGIGLPAADPAKLEPGTAQEIQGVRCVRTTSGAMDLAFSLAAHGDVRIGIYDIGGRRVWSFAGTYAAGTHRVHWDGTGDSGSAAADGVYFVVLEKEGRTSRAKGILVR